VQHGNVNKLGFRAFMASRIASEALKERSSAQSYGSEQIQVKGIL
jgi:hypothetical protein